MVGLDCGRGAAVDLAGPVANDFTLTGTHPSEGSGCFAGGAGISSLPDNPFLLLLTPLLSPSSLHSPIKNNKQTVIFATHNIKFADQAHKKLELTHGKIIE